MIDGPAAGQRIKEMMERRGWSLGTLADRSGVDKGHLSVMLRGRVANPGVGTLRKISDALGVDLSEITGERPMPRRRAEIFERVAHVPVMRVRAHASGRPTWDDTRETVVIEADVIVGRPNARAAVVTGACMGAYVMPGERVVFDPDATPQNGDMVIVTDDEGSTMVKWFRVDGDGQPYLRADDGTTLRPNGAKVEGVVLHIIRRALRDPQA